MITRFFITTLAAMLFSLTTWSQMSYTEDGYRIPTEFPTFTFPRDHGSHPDFRIEWWYITGHLHAQNEDRYGFQATFFRYALKPHAAAGSDQFGDEHIYMAHMALSDVDQKEFYHEERLNRDGWDAFCSTEKMEMQNGNWSLVQDAENRIELIATIQEEVQLNLTLDPAQPHVTFGENGLSKKGAETSACSWYITYPRLQITGDVILNNKSIPVKGEAWMDHEISSSQLSKTQVGWDWLSVRFDDHTELMLYILRDEDGNPDPHSKLVWISADGKLSHMGPDDFTWKVLRRWKSPDSQSNYPVETTLSGFRPDGSPYQLHIKPLFDEQELTGELGGIAYWEGACDILENGKAVGEAYMELTGYNESLESQLR